ncbi:MAG: T9SS type A sorting domain-containing protein [Candidatus Cloacimonetes bacterium]|nr:T9SS type A sorting domain-containing protein [Candidatus Cloacimonadota bacterium]MCF7883540.1 T9SS type A sorting domain-containing protein [Candidatus Cloacimonadota bacterium]
MITNFLYGIFILGDQQSAVPYVDISYNDIWNNVIANYWEEYGTYPNFYSHSFTPVPGTGEIHQDPFFVDPVNGDYHLQSNSPCIDAGDPYLPFDPDGTISDIGAYYYHQNSENDDNVIKYSANLINNYPNPFNPSTTISFNVTQTSTFAIIEVYNLKGEQVKTFAFPNGSPGTSDKSVVWHGDDEFGKPVSSGVYFYKLNVDGKTEAVKKCLLLK